MSRNDKLASGLIWSVSILVFIAVAALGGVDVPNRPAFVYKLPLLNAILNSICTILLACSWVAIKRHKVTLHKWMNISTFILSTLFIVSYVIFHALVEPTKYPAGEPWRGAYYFILISHILLAAAVMPMVLYSFYWALVGEFERHRKLSRFTMPIWLYVTSTGVIVYLMISPYYAF